MSKSVECTQKNKENFYFVKPLSNIFEGFAHSQANYRSCPVVFFANALLELWLGGGILEVNESRLNMPYDPESTCSEHL
jgi:hypothetical protein